MYLAYLPHSNNEENLCIKLSQNNRSSLHRKATLLKWAQEQFLFYSFLFYSHLLKKKKYSPHPSHQVTIDISAQLEPDDSKLGHREPVGSDFPAASLGLHQFLGLMDFSFLPTSTTQAQTLHSIYWTSILITVSLSFFPRSRAHARKLIPRHGSLPCISLFANVFMITGSSPDSSEAFKVFMVLQNVSTKLNDMSFIIPRLQGKRPSVFHSPSTLSQALSLPGQGGLRKLCRWCTVQPQEVLLIYNNYR